MTAKRLIVLSAVWTALMILLAVVCIWYVIQSSIQGLTTDERASRLGSGLGILAAIGYAVLWLPYAAKIGKKRRAERARRL